MVEEEAAARAWASTCRATGLTGELDVQKLTEQGERVYINLTENQRALARIQTRKRKEASASSVRARLYYRTWKYYLYT